MDIKWIEPWEEIPKRGKVFFTKQLSKEITASHFLYRIELTPVGRSLANDDILVSLSNGKFAVVHLTWGGPGDSIWPSAELFDNWEEFANKRMLMDNVGY